MRITADGVTTITSPDGTEHIPAGIDGDGTPYNIALSTVFNQSRGMRGLASSIVVDPTAGKGDYTTVADAVAAASTDDTIYIFGTLAEPATVVPTVDVRICIMPGAIWQIGAFGQTLLQVEGTRDIWIYNLGLMQSLVASLITLDDTASLHLHYGYYAGVGGPAINVLATGTSLYCNHVQSLPGGSTKGLVVPGALANATFMACHFLGTANSVDSAVSWTNAPFYQCLLEGTLNNVSFAAGNNSNVNI